MKITKHSPKTSLLTIYKSFIRRHVDYGVIIHDLASFLQKVESIQYNAVLAITVATCGISEEKLFEKLGFQSQQHR